MNSALKPVLSSSGPQNPQVPTQVNKPMHPQGAPATYGQPPTHLPQSLVNIAHNTNVAHNVNQNHYSLNVPNASQHYLGGNNPQIPISNHPIGQGAGQQPAYSPPKNVTYSSGYQPNLGHPPNQNSLPPVSQTLPATTPVQQQTPAQQSPAQLSSSSSSSESAPSEKPQSNGTSETKSPAKLEQQGNHVSLAKDKPPTPVAPQTSQNTEKLPEKPKPAAQDYKPPEPAKVPEETNVPTPPTIAEPSAPSSAAVVPPTPPVIEKPEKPAALPAPASSTPEKSTAAQPVNAEASHTADAEHSAEPSVGATSEPAQSSPPKSKELVQQKVSSGLTSTKASPVPRTPLRKSKTPKSDAESPKTTKSDKITTTQKSPSSGKTKRQRIRTQPYQSPLPEMEIISKISSSAPRNKNSDDKLIVFYKNEFLAVRNSEGSFFVCQAVQNIYKTSSKIKIRWLSQEKSDKSGEIYTPDFYDLIDFDCILTNLNLSRVDKGKFRLPTAEKERTDSILNRSLAVEKGEVTSPSLTEEHPDGLDLSLYKEESQLNKRKRGGKRKGSKMRASRSTSPNKKSPDQAKVRRIAPKPEKKPVKKTLSAARKAPVVVEVKKPSTSSTRASRAKRRTDNSKTSPVLDLKKAKVLAKVARKGAVVASKASSSTPSTSKSSKVGTKHVTKAAAKQAVASASGSKATGGRKPKRSSRK